MSADPVDRTVRQRGLDRPSRSWITRGLEELCAELESRRRSNQGPGRDHDFDLLIVGSGYGGAIAASSFARRTRSGGAPWRIGVLERGDERLAGSFPSRWSELPGDVRIAWGAQVRGNPFGVYDVRPSADMSALVANGLGGGSLINAGVMAAPDDAVFERDCWPEAIRGTGNASRKRWFDRTRELLGVPGAHRATDDAPRGSRLEVLDRLAAAAPRMRGEGARAASATVDRAQPVAATIARAAASNAAASSLQECNGCGDCATGCNFDAKDSLDLNLLVAAHDLGVQLYTAATVRRLLRPDHGRGWEVEVEHTYPALRRQCGPVVLRAERVILAAGTLGSTEILLRSRTDRLRFSSQLGERLSGNGDAIAAITGLPHGLRAAANDRTAPGRRRIGPTITGMVDLRSGGADGAANGGEPIVIQDLAVPAALRPILEQSVATSRLFASLDRVDPGVHRRDEPVFEPYAAGGRSVRRTLLVAMFGDDGAAGHVGLADGTEVGTARIDWPGIDALPLFDRQLDALRRLVAAAYPPGTADASAPEVLPNALWRLLPDSLGQALGSPPGRAITVHPLGGCAMADSIANGVVDELGRVFDGAGSGTKAVHDGLAVLDGSIVPCALGINPALTISMLTWRACEELWRDPAESSGASPSTPHAAVRSDDGPAAPRGPSRRPPFRPIDPGVPVRREPTEIELVERLVGPVDLMLDGQRRSFEFEITMRFKPARVRRLARTHGPRIEVAPDHPETRRNGMATMPPPGWTASELRVFDRDIRDSQRTDEGDERKYESIDRIEARREATVLVAPLTGGHLQVLAREPSTPGQRRWRALRAWLGNRGVRDILQAIVAWLRRSWAKGVRLPYVDPQDLLPRPGGLLRRISTFWRYFSRAGEERRFHYRVTLGKPEVHKREKALGDKLIEGTVLTGTKVLAYRSGANALDQLVTMQLGDLPVPFAGRRPELRVDANFLAQQGLPLFRIVRMDSLPDAYADLGEWGLTLARMLLGIHLLSFRKPEPPADRVPQRLPGPIPALGARRILEPEVWEIPVAPGRRQSDEPPAGGRADVRVVVRLSRYRDPAATDRAATRNPVVLLHGYGAAGTIFAHPALRPSLAAWLAARGRDVWVADLRTSAGLVQTARLPWRFEDVAWHDIPAIFAHIRSVTGGTRKIDVVAHCMGAMMFSMAVLTDDFAGQPWAPMLEAMPTDTIGRAVLMQVGPAVVFTPANTLRGYLTRSLRDLVGYQSFDFRAGLPPTAGDDLLDRLLFALPRHEPSDLRRENPWWWPGQRASAFVRTRRRLDAMFNEVFRLSNMSSAVLWALDDFFGPINQFTVGQTIRFALMQRPVPAEGAADLHALFTLNPDVLERRWTFPTLHLISERNGLVDPSTYLRSRFAFRSKSLRERYTVEPLRDAGHIDCLIGTPAERTFERIGNFLDQ